MALCCLRIFTFLFSWSKDMPITLGDTSITGLGVGGLPAGTVNATTLASAAVTTVKLADANITAAKLDGAQSGSAPIYAARAWVNFNGTGTVAIRASGNVSSITDNGTGDYTVNFTTAMSDINYSAVMQSTLKNVVYGVTAFVGLSGLGTTNPMETTRFRLMTMTPAEAPQDNSFICVSVFR